MKQANEVYKVYSSSSSPSSPSSPFIYSYCRCPQILNYHFPFFIIIFLSLFNHSLFETQNRIQQLSYSSSSSSSSSTTSSLPLENKQDMMTRFNLAFEFTERDNLRYQKCISRLLKSVEEKDRLLEQKDSEGTAMQSTLESKLSEINGETQTLREELNDWLLDLQEDQFGEENATPWH